MKRKRPVQLQPRWVCRASPGSAAALWFADELQGPFRSATQNMKRMCAQELKFHKINNFDDLKDILKGN